MRALNMIIVTLTILFFIDIIHSQFCGGFVPATEEECTQFNNRIYNCCFALGLNWGSKTPIDPICYGYTTDTDATLITGFWNAGFPYSGISCGTPVKGHMTAEDRCGMVSPQNSTDCYNSGGPKCCYVPYDGFEICLKKNMNNDDLWNDVKYLMKCSGIFLQTNLYSLILYTFIIFLL
jgi:hypothetical protein